MIICRALRNKFGRIANPCKCFIQLSCSCNQSKIHICLFPSYDLESLDNEQISYNISLFDRFGRYLGIKCQYFYIFVRFNVHFCQLENICCKLHLKCLTVLSFTLQLNLYSTNIYIFSAKINLNLESLEFRGCRVAKLI